MSWVGYGIFSRVVPLFVLVAVLEVLAVRFDEVWSFLLCLTEATSLFQMEC
jgi:hypothetical protein